MLDRRTFLSSLAAAPLVHAASEPNTCWLDVAAPFVAVDRDSQISTRILLTATCFPGADGFRNPQFATRYQVLLYDSSGKEIKLDGDGKLEVASLHPTLLNLQELAGRDSFY